MPFDRGRNSLFHYFDELEKNFFNNTGSNTGLNGFKTDIFDKEDHYIRQLDLPKTVPAAPQTRQIEVR